MLEEDKEILEEADGENYYEHSEYDKKLEKQIVNYLKEYQQNTKPKSYKLQEQIGNGIFGRVHKAIDEETGAKVAVKIIDFGFLSKYSFQFEFYHSLIGSKSSNDIPGFVKFLDFRPPLSNEKEYQFYDKCSKIDHSKCPFVVFEYMKNGDISKPTIEYLTNKGQNCPQMNPTIRSKIIFGVAAIMKKIHKKNISFKDLRFEKVFLDDNLEPKIGGFRFAPINYDDPRQVISHGRVIFITPEQINDEPYDRFPVDVYIFAIFLCQMFTKELKLEKECQVNQNFQILKMINEGKRFVRPEFANDNYWELIQHCWDQDPKKRPSFDEITEVLKSDRFALNEFGMETDLDELHRYQNSIDPK